MSYNAIFFFQRLNLIPKGYIILDRMHSFQGIFGDSSKNLWTLSVYEKFYHPGNLTKKSPFLAVNAWKHSFRKNMMTQPIFYY